MKYEIIELHDQQMIGMAKEIECRKGAEQCPEFWQEYVARVVKPIYIEKKEPDEFQQAAVQNNVGSYGLCHCKLTNCTCGECCSEKLKACGLDTFTYMIGGFYQGGPVPEGMSVFPLYSGKWIKFHFVGGMMAFQKQAQELFKEWLPAHPEIKIATNQCMEWYKGTDIQSPDYQCGMLLPIE